jgi:hypothetical protein
MKGESRMYTAVKEVIEVESAGKAHCYMCSHMVDARVVTFGNRMRTVAGQACGRCGSSLDSACVLFMPHEG